jgi:hypothetical protein
MGTSTKTAGHHESDSDFIMSDTEPMPREGARRIISNQRPIHHEFAIENYRDADKLRSAPREELQAILAELIEERGDSDELFAEIECDGTDDELRAEVQRVLTML